MLQTTVFTPFSEKMLAPKNKSIKLIFQVFCLWFFWEKKVF